MSSANNLCNIKWEDRKFATTTHEKRRWIFSGQLVRQRACRQRENKQMLQNEVIPQLDISKLAFNLKLIENKLLMKINKNTMLELESFK